MTNSNRNPVRNIRIADEVWNQAKSSAALEGTTLQSWITLAILHRIASKATSGEKKATL